MPIAEVEGRIPGFNNHWNKRLCDTINKEDMLRWETLEKQMEIEAKTGLPRRPVKLPRPHTNIGAYPGCKRNVLLSPRKSAAICFLEQKLLKSSCSDPAMPTVRERLYEGTSQTEEGRYAYLKLRNQMSTKDRYGGPQTTSQLVGLERPKGEYRASKFARTPGIIGEIMRPCGTQTHLNLPDGPKPTS
eukprot:gnl/TRDRNA2_/TRDRNA2_180347_c0_seq1.p1 gnl/TRDRNA2_/TRDRNA2_180347_c0~~gnl/TRDRNA2_/TRDRNA2_180347_c0_seq1.p1  ORF type:complete len:188 (+),score=24.02 gnl/TRDRNA2_/TRDRNA2_180347_c0_seq1:115-678(+)